jgi:hypothetical protein
MVGVPDTIRRGKLVYRGVFGRAEDFEQVSRYVTGLILSPNKTLRGIYDAQKARRTRAISAIEYW